MKADECITCETDRRQLAEELKRERERDRTTHAAPHAKPDEKAPAYCSSCLTTLNLRTLKDGVVKCVYCIQSHAPTKRATTLANSYAAPRSAQQTDLNRIY